MELFADKLELAQLLDVEHSEVQEEEQDETVVDKGKSPSLYNDDEVPLSQPWQMMITSMPGVARSPSLMFHD